MTRSSTCSSSGIECCRVSGKAAATSRELIIASCLCVCLAVTGCGPQQSADLVVYCAHDAHHAEQVIDEFEHKTGLKVDVRFDEEASKSLGLTNLILAERDHPRCDVFWNNQALGTIRLAEAGVLHPYISPNAKRIPTRYRNTEGLWTGFAARMRVFLVNTDHVANPELAIAELTAQSSLSRVAIAQPMFGTTLSHYSVLAALWGAPKMQAWHKDLQARGIREVRGNAMTKDLVAEGICDIAFTDTDDAFAAVDAGKPVTMLPVRLDDQQTICLPNTVAIIARCPHQDNARRFIDFMLSAETELMLARSTARQIPLGDVPEHDVPHDVKKLRTWAVDGIDLSAAASVNEATLEWLKQEYTGQ